MEREFDGKKRGSLGSEVFVIAEKNVSENLTALASLLGEYFDSGNGSSLSEEEQFVVAVEARSLAFMWSWGKLIKEGIIDRNEVPSWNVGYLLLEQEYGIKSYYEIGALVERFSLTDQQRKSIDRRAWNLAKKALKKTEDA